MKRLFKTLVLFLVLIIVFTGCQISDLEASMEYVEDGNKLFEQQKYEEAIVQYNRAKDLYANNATAYNNIGAALTLLDKAQESIVYFDMAINLDSNYIEAYLWKSKSLIQQGCYDEAIDVISIIIAKYPENVDALYTKVIAYLKIEKFNEALVDVDKVITLDDSYLDGYMTKLSILYKLEYYKECIDFGNKALAKFPNNEDVLWYIADSYFSQYNYEEAIDSYKKVLKVNPENEGVLTYLGWSYYSIEDYDNAQYALTKALDINPQSSIAMELENSIEETKLPEGKRIVEFVKNNYLYIDKINDFNTKSDKFAKKSNVTYREIEDYLDSIIQKDDYFTFILYGDEYDILESIESENQIEHRKYGEDSYYIKIKSFSSSTGGEFREVIKGINSNYTKNLIIDLRDNTGGYTEASNQILDQLLPICITSTLIYRDGSEEIYESYEGQIKFKNIVILVNENSASSAELLTLGLKLKLDNVTIIGSRTYGKGVGQEIFENKSKKYAIFLVSFYWNIDKKNINGTGIKPDILINSHSDNDYFNEVDKIIK